MAESDELSSLQSSMRAPAAAGVAGILFSLIFALVVVEIRRVVPADATDAGAWLSTEQRRNEVSGALALLPFAGIAFLWFIGVIRDHLGSREDRFFATVFLGSGLTFVALMFVAGAIAASLIGVSVDGRPPPELWAFGRRLIYTLVNTYALRMAAVFTIATSTLAGRLRLVPRWLAVVGFLTAATLLVAVTVVPTLVLLFPLWVLLLSVHILVASTRRARPGGAAV